MQNDLAVKRLRPIFATRLTQTSINDGRFVYRLGQPPFTGQRRVRFPYRLQSLSRKWEAFLCEDAKQARLIERMSVKKAKQTLRVCLKGFGLIQWQGQTFERSENGSPCFGKVHSRGRQCEAFAVPDFG